MKQEVRDVEYDYIGITDDLECAYSGDTLDSFLAEVTQNIVKIKQEYIKDYHTRHEIYRDNYGYDGGYTLCLILYRLETDEEYSARLECEREQLEKSERARLAKLEKKLAKQAAEEAAERAEYARLREKYGS
jgi:hypothetical protein